MKLAMNMLLWSTDVCDPSYDATFAMLKDAGFDGVEIPIFDREVDKYAALGERLDALGLERIAVGARTADDNPISEDPAMRAEAAAATRANLDTAAAMGATLICGPLGAPLGVFSGAPPTAEEKARSVAYLQEVAPYAEERGVTIALEYLSRFEMYLTNTAADLAALVREVGHPSVRMMYDTFHAHIEEKDPRAALEACKDVLVHVHLSESDRSTPGTGQVAWRGDVRRPARDRLRPLGRDRGVRRLAARARRGDEDLAPHVRERGAARPRRRGVHPERPRVLARGGQRERHARAAWLARLRPHASALRLDEAAGDREPEPRPAADGARGVAAPEAVEHAPCRLGGDALAGVLDGHAHGVVGRGDDDGDRSVGRRVAERVRQQVEQDPLDLLRCAARRRRRLDAALETTPCARASASKPRRHDSTSGARLDDAAARSVRAPASMRASSKRSSTSPASLRACSCSGGR